MQRVVERRLRLLALLPFHRFDHAAHAEQRVETRRLKPGQVLRPLRHGLALGAAQPRSA